MTPIAILSLLSSLVVGLPELEAAVSSLTAMVSGQTLTPAQLEALGTAMVAAHRRVQGTPAA